MKKPGFTNLTALTTLYVGCPMNHLRLSILLHLPRLAHLSTSAPLQTDLLADAASVTLRACLKSFSFFNLCPVLDSIFSLTSPFTGLEELLISFCNGPESLPHHIGDLPAGFCRLTALKALSFSRLQHLVLPEDVGALGHLEALKLHDFQDLPLPASFTELSSLTSLELNRCGGIHLPEALGELSSLLELKFVDLSISTLPSSLTWLTRLEALEVRGCSWLSEVPSRLDTLVKLKRLEMLACPQLSEPCAGLPPSLESLSLGPFKEGSFHVVDISHLTQLRVLKLNRIGVQCGPAVSSRVLCLQQLEQLEMHVESGNQQLPVPLTFLPRLRSLLIDAPGVCSLPENMGAALSQLRQLQLLSWSQEELPGSIVGIRKLTSLKLRAPRLVALPQGMSCLARLRKLELVDCDTLQHLPECLTQLHHLILWHTPIRSLPANLVQLAEQP
ncbi:unnamed protein product [Closterium sp. NIES-64]|nr:unnamed protein product [Closterium sp. NIES-64]CAI5994713.1 unnamed protein product [Closterium sp. NIES-65]